MKRFEVSVARTVKAACPLPIGDPAILPVEDRLSPAGNVPRLSENL